MNKEEKLMAIHCLQMIRARNDTKIKITGVDVRLENINETMKFMNEYGLLMGYKTKITTVDFCLACENCETTIYSEEQDDAYIMPYVIIKDRRLYTAEKLIFSGFERVGTIMEYMKELEEQTNIFLSTININTTT